MPIADTSIGADSVLIAFEEDRDLSKFLGVDVSRGIADVLYWRDERWPIQRPYRILSRSGTGRHDDCNYDAELDSHARCFPPMHPRKQKCFLKSLSMVPLRIKVAR